MKNRPGYWTALSNSWAFSGIWIVPRSRFGSNDQAVVRDVVVAVVGRAHRLDEHVHVGEALRVRAVHARRQVVELLDGGLAARRLVAVGRAGDPAEGGADPNLRERRRLWRRAADDATPEGAVVAAGVEVRDVVGVPTTMIDIGTPSTLVPAE